MQHLIALNPLARFSLPALAALICAVSGANAQTIQHQILVMTGDAAPGVSSATLNTISASSSSRDGRITFQASITGPSVNMTNNSGIWISPPGLAPNRLVARMGAMAPGGMNYNNFSNPRVGAGGHSAFVMDTGGVGEATLFGVVGQPDSLGSLLYNLMASPGVSPRRFLIFHVEAVNAAGTGVAEALLDDVSSRGIWVGVPGNLVKLVSSGDAAPGYPGTTFIRASDTSINSQGAVAFAAELSGDMNLASSIWRGTPGNLAPVFRAGTVMPNGEVLKTAQSPVINDANTIAFRGATTTVSDGIWIHTTQGAQRVVAAGQTAPGIPGGRTFSAFKSVSLNSAGQIVFEASLTGDAASAQTLWRRDSDGTLVLIAQAGAGLPTRAGGASLSQFYSDKHSLMENGDVIFRARFTNNGATTWGVYRSSVTRPVVTVAPTVKFTGGPVFRTKIARVHLRGSTVSGGASVLRVEFRREKDKTFSRATGTSKWSARPRVPVGRSKIVVGALAADGKRSKPITARVLRSK